MSDFKETWDDLVKFVFTAFLTAHDDPGAEEAVEKFMAVDQVFKDFCEVCLALKAHEDHQPNLPESDLDCSDDAAGIVMCGWEDENGVMHYQYASSNNCCPVRVPMKVSVTVEEFMGDDLTVPK